MQPSASAALPAASRISREHLRERAGVEVALVDEQRRPARNGGDDAGLAARVADRADAAVTTCDLAELEREARRGQERVAAPVDRRRARVGGLPVEDETVPLHPDGAEHRADREALGLEHRPLLDVQLEVGALRARAATPPRARGRARHRARAPRPRGAGRRSRPDPAPRRDRASPPQPSCRTGCDRSGHPPRPPSRRVRPSRAAGRSPPPRAAPRAPPSRRARRRASRRSAPSRRASRRPPCRDRSPSSTAQTLPASSTSTRTGSSARRSRTNPRARTHSSVQHRRRAPSGPPVSSASPRRSAITRDASNRRRAHAASRFRGAAG